MKANLIALRLIASALCAIVLPNPGVAQITHILQNPEQQDTAFRTEYLVLDDTKFIYQAWHGRRIAVLLEPQVFTLENIRSVFVHLAREYPADPLLIDAGSNSEQFEGTTRWFPEIQSFPFGKVLRPIMRCGTVVGPRLSAEYVRSEYGWEFFHYYPATDDAIHVELKRSSPDCAVSGDPTFDLIDASMRGCEDVVRELLDAGADPNVKSRYGGGVLVEAAYWGQQTEIVKLLLERGADVNQTSASGWTPLIAAISGNRYHRAVAEP